MPQAWVVVVVVGGGGCCGSDGTSHLPLVPDQWAHHLPRPFQSEVQLTHEIDRPGHCQTGRQKDRQTRACMVAVLYTWLLYLWPRDGPACALH